MPSSHTFGKIRARIRDAKTGALIRETKFHSNLVFDLGLNALANGCGFSAFFSHCLCGSSTLPNSVASGAITFNQAGTTITASGGFFTPAMTGALLKYGLSGAGGAEVYLTYVDSTHATASAAVAATNLPGTVYMVNQTGLGALEYATNTCDTSAGNNKSTFTATTCTLQRVFNFGVQSSSYIVNEIGYSNGSSGNCNGRVVLPVTLVVATSQYLEVTVIMTFTASPAVPAAVANVGPAAFNTAGTVMQQAWNCSAVGPGGAVIKSFAQANGLTDGAPVDGSPLIFSLQSGTPPALNATLLAITPPLVPAGVIFFDNTIPQPSNTGQSVGVGISTVPFSITTAGQIITHLIFGFIDYSDAGSLYDNMQLNLSAPQILPTGLFAGSLSFQWTFARQLSN
jgi:hypothetical protein